MNDREGSKLTPSQQAMADLWDKHMEAEFASHSVEETLETMVEDKPYVSTTFRCSPGEWD
jgi:hypothetical protein